MAKLPRAGLGIAAAASMFGGMLITLSACGGGSWPMTVEQRYSEPKAQDEILQEKIEAANRAERAHGSK
ncbi:MAG: hypothetical protein L0I29_06265 [Hyphomicrobiales bacterium]|nr:hypothetical protein [Hyphomicrobiales bacterium]